MDLTLRRADADDAEAIAAVFSPSRRLLTFAPELHTVEEDRRFIADIVMTECDVTLGEIGGVVVAFMARDKVEIRHLFVHPDFIRRGLGSALLDHTMKSEAVLELWCFCANTQARRFYEKRGFRPIQWTDGKRNEEQLPDVRYRWERWATR
jgi:GNAT superfamily N-acetyltransferase